MPILTNYQKSQNLKHIYEQETYKCIICPKGNVSFPNFDLSNCIGSYYKKNLEITENSQKCKKHNEIFKTFCLICECSLCSSCWDEHNDEHEFRNLKLVQKNIVYHCYEHKEKFIKICTPSNTIISNLCYRHSYNNDFTSCIDDDYFKKIKNELKLQRMPNNINTKDEFIQKINEEEKIFLTRIQNDPEDIKSKISELIMYLYDINHYIRIHFDKLENDFIFNSQFIKQIFTNIIEISIQLKNLIILNYIILINFLNL